MTAFHAMLASTEPLEQQPVPAPVTVLLVGFRQPVISQVRLRTTALRVALESISTWLEVTKQMTAFFAVQENMEPLEQQPVPAPVTVLLVGFRQPVISLVRMRTTALRVALESISTWLEVMKQMTAFFAVQENMERLEKQPVPAPVTVLLVGFRQPVISLVRMRTTALLALLESMVPLARQPVLAPVTVLLVAFRQPVISLVRLRTIALRVTLEGTDLLAQQPVPAPVTVLPVAFRQPVISLVRLRTTALRVTLESTDLLAQQPVPAPVTVLLVAFRQPVISLVRLRTTALRVALESISTWLEVMNRMTAFFAVQENMERLEKQPVPAPVTVLLVGFRQPVISLVRMRMSALRVTLDGILT
jgi:hypothetical protein